MLAFVNETVSASRGAVLGAPGLGPLVVQDDRLAPAALDPDSRSVVGVGPPHRRGGLPGAAGLLGSVGPEVDDSKAWGGDRGRDRPSRHQRRAHPLPGPVRVEIRCAHFQLVEPLLELVAVRLNARDLFAKLVELAILRALPGRAATDDAARPETREARTNVSAAAAARSQT